MKMYKSWMGAKAFASIKAYTAADSAELKHLPLAGQGYLCRIVVPLLFLVVIVPSLNICSYISWIFWLCSSFLGLFAHDHLISNSWERKKTWSLLVSNQYLEEYVLFVRKSTDGTVLELILEEFSGKVSLETPSLRCFLNHKFPTSH